MLLKNKRILIGISGGIAAYKIPELVRRLQDHGAEIRVVMTPAATAFITPMTLQAVSGHPVSTDLLDPAAEGSMGHIELARWADMVLLAPATADLLARIRVGMANDLLSTLCLATEAPIVLAPAMNQQMWQARATQDNMAHLAQVGYPIWGPGQGSQACGEVGPGRMLEVAELVERTCQFFNHNASLSGKRVMITAGPTREAVDPVRFISNHSSGKMGFALAEAAANAGAEVTLVAGPVNLPTPAGCKRIDVESAMQMYDAVMAEAAEQSIFIACAAVADFRPADVAEQKIKKGTDEQMQLTLVKNPDIVASVAALATRPYTVGFAAETNHVEAYAKSKMAQKGLDMIAANDVTLPGLGFNSDNNALQVYTPNNHVTFGPDSKTTLAGKLISLIADQQA